MKVRVDTVLDRMAESRWTLPVLAVLVVLALTASTFTIVQWAKAQGQRDADIAARADEQTAAAVASCERGNVLRGQVVDIGKANEALVEGVLDVVLGFVSNPDTVARIRTDIEPVFAEHRAAVEVIELTNCRRVTPGATSTSLPGENP